MSLASTLIHEITYSYNIAPTYRLRGQLFVPQWWLDDIDWLFWVLGEIYMPAKKKGNKGYNNGSSFEFVNIKVDAAKKEAAKSWCADCVEHIHEILPEFLQDGYKFSVSWDENNETFIGSMTNRSEGHVNYQKTLTSRSNDWLEAIVLNIYKTREMCTKDVWPEQGDNDSWG